MQTLPMRTVLLISGLMLLVIVLLVAAFSAQQTQDQKLPPAQTLKENPPPTKTPSAKLELSPSETTVPKGTTQTLSVVITAQDNIVSGVQLQLSYDPTLVTIVEITPGSFFTSPIILPAAALKTQGTRDYSIAVGPGLPGKKGSGTVAIVHYRLNQTAPSGTRATIDLLPSSLITEATSTTSILHQTTGATITAE